MEFALQSDTIEVGFDNWGCNSMDQLKVFGDVDLILLDLMLPNNLSGFAVYQQIRDDPQYAETPVIVVSASEPAIVLHRLKVEGFAGLISTPMDIFKLPQDIAKIMKAETFIHIEYKIMHF
jgi:CheY-like chemotaxis protein